METLAQHHFPALGAHVKLGALPPREDKHVLKLANYKTTELPAPPISKQWGVKVPTFPMYANDKLGDCTCAAVGHMEQVWTSQAGQIWTPTTTEVTDLYWATGSQDTGRVETDVLDYWKNTGFGDLKHKIAGYVSVNPLNHTEVMTAAYLFGGLYIGIALPITAQNQTYWHVVNDGYNSEPGSWGGHAVNVTAYCGSYLVVATWGMRMKMTWGWWNKYTMEAYAVLSYDWVNKAKDLAACGYSFEALEADLAAL